MSRNQKTIIWLCNILSLDI